MFRISMWDEFTGDPAQDLGVECSTEQHAREAAQATWDEVNEEAGTPREELEWDGPMAEATYDPGMMTPGTTRVIFWVHATS